MVEVHPVPSQAYSDGEQSLTPENFKILMKEIKMLIKASSQNKLVWIKDLCLSEMQMVFWPRKGIIKMTIQIAIDGPAGAGKSTVAKY